MVKSPVEIREWISAEYLKKSTLQQINDAFSEESQIELADFFNHEKYK
jgi:hypothetical protein